MESAGPSMHLQNQPYSPFHQLVLQCLFNCYKKGWVMSAHTSGVLELELMESAGPSMHLQNQPYSTFHQRVLQCLFNCYKIRWTISVHTSRVWRVQGQVCIRRIYQIQFSTSLFSSACFKVLSSEMDQAESRLIPQNFNKGNVAAGFQKNMPAPHPVRAL